MRLFKASSDKAAITKVGLFISSMEKKPSVKLQTALKCGKYPCIGFSSTLKSSAITLIHTHQKEAGHIPCGMQPFSSRNDTQFSFNIHIEGKYPFLVLLGIVIFFKRSFWISSISSERFIWLVLFIEIRFNDIIFSFFYFFLIRFRREDVLLNIYAIYKAFKFFFTASTYQPVSCGASRERMRISSLLLFFLWIVIREITTYY